MGAYYRHDTTYLIVTLVIRDVEKGGRLRISNVTADMTDYPDSKRKYVLRAIDQKKMRPSGKSQYQPVEVDSAFQGGKTTELTTGYSYFFSCRFFSVGHKHYAHKVHVNIGAVITDGMKVENLGRAVVFERHNHFNIAGD